MAKKFYTERDIQDMARRGETSLSVNDDVVLTDLAFELAVKHNIRIVRDAPIQQEDHNNDELIRRVKAVVISRLGGDVNMEQLDTVVRRVVKAMS